MDSSRGAVDDELIQCPLCGNPIPASQLESHWKTHEEGDNNQQVANEHPTEPISGGSDQGDHPQQPPLDDDVSQVELEKQTKSSIDIYGKFFDVDSESLNYFESVLKKLQKRGASIQFAPIDLDKSSKKKDIFVHSSFAFDLFENDIVFPIGTTGFMRAAVLYEVLSQKVIFFLILFLFLISKNKNSWEANKLFCLMVLQKGLILTTT